MFHLFTPLDEHCDKGFGAVAESFKDAADSLFNAKEGVSIFHGHLPISFLYRHATELYLKASIIICHKYLRQPYGTHPCNGDPYVLVEGKWKPIYTEHSIDKLFEYLKSLFHSNKDCFIGNVSIVFI
jgi:hypothetical protein